MSSPSLTVVLRFEGDTLAQVLKTQTVLLDAHDPYLDSHVRLNGQRVPLAANFTAGYGVWMARSDFNRQSLRGLFGRAQGIARPHLYMMQPYDPKRRVILMLHGLASSPEAWVNVANELMGDPVLRQHFQVWQVYYPTNMPIAANHAAIRRVLTRTLQHMDPQGTAQASRDMVLIGHSMGGVMARLMVSSAEDELLALLADPREHAELPAKVTPSQEGAAGAGGGSAPEAVALAGDEVAAPPEAQDEAPEEAQEARADVQAARAFATAHAQRRRAPVADANRGAGEGRAAEGELALAPSGGASRALPDGLEPAHSASGLPSREQRQLRAVLRFAPYPGVTRAVFIAAPHRGTQVAGYGVVRWVSGLIRFPVTMLEGFGELLQLDLRGLVERQGTGQLRISDMPSSLSNLDARDPFVQAAAGLPISSAVRYHSIIARTSGEGELRDTDDGLVPYASSHLAGAASEKVIVSGHSVQETAAAILELRRILHLDVQAKP